MMTLRRLDPTADLALFAETWQWLEESPPWRKETEAIFGTVDHDEYFAALRNPERIDIGVFDGPLTALVTLALRGRNIYEVHFEAKRGTRAESVIWAGWEIGEQMFSDYGMEMAYTWTPRWNRRVLAINKAIGFQPDNVTMLHGTCRGRLVEWVRYSIRKPYGR